MERFDTQKLRCLGHSCAQVFLVPCTTVFLITTATKPTRTNNYEPISISTKPQPHNTPSTTHIGFAHCFTTQQPVVRAERIVKGNFPTFGCPREVEARPSRDDSRAAIALERVMALTALRDTRGDMDSEHWDPYSWS